MFIVDHATFGCGRNNYTSPEVGFMCQGKMHELLQFLRSKEFVQHHAFGRQNRRPVGDPGAGLRNRRTSLYTRRLRLTRRLGLRRTGPLHGRSRRLRLRVRRSRSRLANTRRLRLSRWLWLRVARAGITAPRLRILDLGVRGTDRRTLAAVRFGCRLVVFQDLLDDVPAKHGKGTMRHRLAYRPSNHRPDGFLRFAAAS